MENDLKIIEEIKSMLSVREVPEFNGKECKNGCNCIEIAVAENFGDEIKDYACHEPSINSEEKTTMQKSITMLNTIKNQQKRYVIYTPVGRIFTDSLQYCLDNFYAYKYHWEENPNYKPENQEG